MSNYNKLLNNLEKLKLDKFKENLNTYIDLINDKKINIVDALYKLTEEELMLKTEKAIHGCVKVANFPFIKTLDDYDFSFQPAIQKFCRGRLFRCLYPLNKIYAGSANALPKQKTATCFSICPQPRPQFHLRCGVQKPKTDG